jgi:transcriptional regulator with XRE-family HTH domain
MEKEIFTTGSIGRKIERVRKIKGVNQETLANLLGMTRQSFAKLEQAEDIDDDKLEQIANALGVPVDAIKQFDEEKTIQNIFNDQCTGFNFNCTFNPLEKIVELYDALLKSEREKNEMLQKLLEQK